jgi:hypothetical protein
VHPSIEEALVRLVLPVVAIALLACPASAQQRIEVGRGYVAHAVPEPQDSSSRLVPRGVACAPDRAYVIGFGSVAVVPWEGTRWGAPLPAPDPRAQAETIAVAPSGHVWFGARGRALLWDGSAWSQLLVQGVPDWERVAVVPVSDDEAYAIALDRLLRLEHGRFWWPLPEWASQRVDATRPMRFFRAYDPSTWRELTAIAVGPGRDLWLGTQGGLVLRHDGTRWEQTWTGTDTDITGLLVVSAGDVWAWGGIRAGERRLLVHLERGSWTDRLTGLQGAVRSLARLGHSIYAVGEFGLARWTGTAWSVEISPATLSARLPRDVARFGAITSMCATRRQIVMTTDQQWIVVRDLPR